MDEPEPVQVEFMVFQKGRPYFKDYPHPKAYIFREMIRNHTCFHEKQEGKPQKWNKKHGHGHGHGHTAMSSSSRKGERTKIGSNDTSREGVFRKECVSLLNKLTGTNLSVMVRQMRTIFEKEFMQLFVDTLFEYLTRQPEFQHLYIHVMVSIYPLLQEADLLEMNRMWQKHWDNYISHETWKFERELVEQSHNYDDFCEYTKEKKKKVAYIQAWTRLYQHGSISTDIFVFVDSILSHCESLDMADKIDKTVIDNYIEQIRELYRLLPADTIEDFHHRYLTRLEGLKNKKGLGKASYFKLVDFIEASGVVAI